LFLENQFDKFFVALQGRKMLQQVAEGRAVDCLRPGETMKRRVSFWLGVVAISFGLLFGQGLGVARATDGAIVSQTALVGGVKLHYLKAGQGPAVILLHGYTQTSRMWRPIMPLLAEKFTVVAPDLPGIGDSEIPKTGLDMKLAAISIHGLAKSLGIEKARVVGHDIGLMVAYAYAAQFPGETEKLAVMDAFLPGVAGWEDVYNNPGIWHFRFNGPTPEALVRGRERTYFDYFWNDFAAVKNHSLPEADRIAYTAAYARPGRMHAGWEYFVSFQQAAKDFAELSKTKLTMPVLAIGGEKANGTVLGEQMKLVATNATMVVLKDCGHWVLEEKPKETTEALVKFL
jgi:pimeloyl-ACP methyl ester carboxylesterase